MIIDDTLSETDFDACFAGEPIEPTDPVLDVRRGRLLRRRRRALALALPTAAAAAGLTALVVHQPIVATPSAPPSARPTSSRGQEFLLPPDAARRIHYGATMSDPAPRDSSTRITSAEALKLTRTSWRGDTASPSIALRLLSARGSTSGVVDVAEDPHLYWVIVWKTTGSLGVPAASNPEEQAEWQRSADRWSATAQCRSIMFVDADTGRGADSTETDCMS